MAYAQDKLFIAFTFQYLHEQRETFFVWGYWNGYVSAMENHMKMLKQKRKKKKLEICRGTLLALIVTILYRTANWNWECENSMQKGSFFSWLCPNTPCMCRRKYRKILKKFPPRKWKLYLRVKINPLNSKLDSSNFHVLIFPSSPTCWEKLE